MWSSATQIVTSVVSIVSVVWLIISQVRSSSARKHADRAETATRLLATLEVIGVGGIDRRYDGVFRLEIHSDQIHRLQEVIRTNTAEFERRAQKATGWPLAAHFLIAAYGVLLLTVLPRPLSLIGDLPTDEQWIGVLIVGGLFVLSIAMIVDLLAALDRRTISRDRQRDAGKYVPGALEIISTSVIGIALWRQRKRDRRTESGRRNTSETETNIDRPLKAGQLAPFGAIIGFLDFARLPKRNTDLDEAASNVDSPTAIPAVDSPAERSARS